SVGCYRRYATDRRAAAARAGDGAVGHCARHEHSFLKGAASSAPFFAFSRRNDGDGALCRWLRQSSQRLALEPGVDALDHLAVMATKTLFGEVAEMRRQHDVVELAEGM